MIQNQDIFKYLEIYYIFKSYDSLYYKNYITDSMKFISMSRNQTNLSQHDIYPVPSRDINKFDKSQSLHDDDYTKGKIQRLITNNKIIAANYYHAILNKLNQIPDEKVHLSNNSNSLKKQMLEDQQLPQLSNRSGPNSRDDIQHSAQFEKSRQMSQDQIIRYRVLEPLKNNNMSTADIIRSLRSSPRSKNETQFDGQDQLNGVESYKDLNKKLSPLKQYKEIDLGYNTPDLYNQIQASNRKKKDQSTKNNHQEFQGDKPSQQLSSRNHWFSNNIFQNPKNQVRLPIPSYDDETVGSQANFDYKKAQYLNSPAQEHLNPNKSYRPDPQYEIQKLLQETRKARQNPIQETRFYQYPNVSSILSLPTVQNDKLSHHKKLNNSNTISGKQFLGVEGSKQISQKTILIQQNHEEDSTDNQTKLKNQKSEKSLYRKDLRVQEQSKDKILKNKFVGISIPNFHDESQEFERNMKPKLLHKQISGMKQLVVEKKENDQNFVKINLPSFNNEVIEPQTEIEQRNLVNNQSSESPIEKSRGNNSFVKIFLPSFINDDTETQNKKSPLNSNKQKQSRRPLQEYAQKQYSTKVKKLEQQDDDSREPKKKILIEKGAQIPKLYYNMLGELTGAHNFYLYLKLVPQYEEVKLSSEPKQIQKQALPDVSQKNIVQIIAITKDMTDLEITRLKHQHNPPSTEPLKKSPPFFEDENIQQLSRLMSDQPKEKSQLNSTPFTPYSEFSRLVQTPVQPSQIIKTYDTVLPQLENQKQLITKGKFIELVQYKTQKKVSVLIDKGLYLQNQGIALQKQERNKEAIIHYKQAIEANPKLDIARINLGALLSRYGKYEEAQKVFDDAITQTPNNANLYLNKGISLKNQNQYQAALDCFLIATTIDQENILAFINKAYVQYQLRQNQEAIISLENSNSLLQVARAQQNFNDDVIGPIHQQINNILDLINEFTHNAKDLEAAKSKYANKSIPIKYKKILDEYEQLNQKKDQIINDEFNQIQDGMEFSSEQLTQTTFYEEASALVEILDQLKAKLHELNKKNK